MKPINCFELPSICFCLLDYRDILKSCESQIIDDLHQFHLLDNLNMSKNDVKKVMYHHVIHMLCESVMNVRTNNKVIVYNNMDNLQLDLFKYSTRTQITNFLNTLTRKIKTLLPIKIYDHEDDYDVFVDRCKESTAELRSRALLVDQFLKRQSEKKFDFEKVNKFASKFELTYLSQQYFNKMKIKNLVFI